MARVATPRMASRRPLGGGRCRLAARPSATSGALLKPQRHVSWSSSPALSAIVPGAGSSASGARRSRPCCASRSAPAPRRAINMWYDRDIDAAMARTAARPAAAGPDAAGRGAGVRRRARDRLRHGDGAGASTGWPPALLALTIAFYVFVYTMWLKRRTPQNIVIGGAAGALPPMVGWAAVTGDVALLRGRCCSLIIFFWTPPHFWALSLYRTATTPRPACRCCRSSPGRARPSAQILVYTAGAVAVALVPYAARPGRAALWRRRVGAERRVRLAYRRAAVARQDRRAAAMRHLPLLDRSICSLLFAVLVAGPLAG